MAPTTNNKEWMINLAYVIYNKYAHYYNVLQIHIPIRLLQIIIRNSVTTIVDDDIVIVQVKANSLITRAYNGLHSNLVQWSTKMVNGKIIPVQMNNIDYVNRFNIMLVHPKVVHISIVNNRVA